MAGALPGRSFDAGKLTRFGYLTLTAQRDNLLCRAGESIAAHEFHRWDADDPGEAFLAEKPSGRRWPCVHATGTLYAGYPHFPLLREPRLRREFSRRLPKGEAPPCLRPADPWTSKRAASRSSPSFWATGSSTRKTRLSSSAPSTPPRTLTTPTTSSSRPTPCRQGSKPCGPAAISSPIPRWRRPGSIRPSSPPSAARSTASCPTPTSQPRQSRAA